MGTGLKSRIGGSGGPGAGAVQSYPWNGRPSIYFYVPLDPGFRAGMVRLTIRSLAGSIIGSARAPRTIEPAVLGCRRSAVNTWPRRACRCIQK